MTPSFETHCSFQTCKTIFNTRHAAGHTCRWCMHVCIFIVSAFKKKTEWRKCAALSPGSLNHRQCQIEDVNFILNHTLIGAIICLGKTAIKILITVLVLQINNIGFIVLLQFSSAVLACFWWWHICSPKKLLYDKEMSDYLRITVDLSSQMLCMSLIYSWLSFVVPFWIAVIWDIGVCAATLCYELFVAIILVTMHYIPLQNEVKENKL